MLKGAFTAAVILAAAATPSFAGPDGTYWDGALTVYKASSACGERVGNTFKSTYRPGGRQNNDGNTTYISVVYSNGAASIALPKNRRSGQFEIVGVGARGNWWASDDSHQKFKKKRTKPKRVKKNTKTVELSIRMLGFWSVPGCKVTLKGSYIANPNN